MAHALRYLIARPFHCRAGSPNPAGFGSSRCRAAGFGDPALHPRGHRLARFVFLVLVLALTSARAEPAPPERRLRFTVFSPRPATGLVYTPQLAQPPAPLVFYPTARSPRYPYRGVMPLRFRDAKNNMVVAEATIPPEITDALLLLVPIEPAPTTGLRYQVYVLDDAATRQAPGSLAIINFSGFALNGTIDGKPATLQAGLNAVQPVGKSAAVALRAMFKARSYQAYAGTVELAKKERALLLLLPPFYKGSLEVQSRLLIDTPPMPGKF
jgi:hypothetical protein